MYLSLDIHDFIYYNANMKPISIPYGVLFLLLIPTLSLAVDGGDGLAGFMDTDQFKGMVSQQAANSKAIAGSIGPDAITQAMNKLPHWTSDPGQLKYGQHRTVSPQGEEVITLIRQAFTSNPDAQRNALLKLHDYSEQGIPEAITFFGFAHDYGLLGLVKNQVEAMNYYEVAARQGYQPAVYDLAIHAIYSMGEPQDLQAADRYLIQAMTYGQESSYRVCGMQSFIEYRLGITHSAQVTLSQCDSPLVNLSLAQSGRWQSAEKMVKGLRQSIGTGLDDGYPLLVHVGEVLAGHDPVFYYCKYSLLNKLREHSLDKAQLQTDATRCVDTYSPETFTPTQKYLAASGVAGFIPAEISALRTLRKSNHFHYNLAVPYLPFTQLDIDMLASAKGTQKSNAITSP